MKNKNGFTLIEIIGTVIILGILAIITIPMFTKNLEGFRDDYYLNIEKTLKNSGKEFFNDNRKYRPNKYLESSKVTLATLEGMKYLDSEVVDYEGNSCDKDSYVIVIRKGRYEYDYHVCLTCANDDYETVSDNKYCNSSWDVPVIDYTLGDVEDIYVYKGIDKNTLIEKTSTPLSVIKKDEDGNILEQVKGDGDESVEYITPINIDSVNTNVVGEYTLIYEYATPDDGDDTTEDKVTKEGKVIVYENSSPVITVTKINNVATSVSSNSNLSSDYGLGGTWAQQLTISFVRGDGKYDETGTTTSKYQWKRGNKWIDFCTDIDVTGNCSITIGKKSNDALGLEFEMNEDVQFRIVDTEGNISLASPVYRFMIDNTNPTCNVQIPSYTGVSDWFNIDVNVSMINTSDVVGTVSSAVSGVKYYSIDGSQLASRTVTGTTNGISHGTYSGIQNTDTAGTTWYGFVEDNAQNYHICSTVIKRDTVNPIATWTPTSTTHQSNNAVNVSAICSDALSGVTSPANSVSQSVSSPTTSSGVNVSIACTDIAGNTISYSQNYKIQAYYNSDCGRCGDSSCTSSACCGTGQNCSPSETVFACGSCSGETDCYTITSLGTCLGWCSDAPCKRYTSVSCSSYAKTCSSSCCGCESCWAYQ